MNILISAYGCGPGRGSEPGVGWNWTKEVASEHNVWVLTPESERAAIEDYRGSDLPANLLFVHCDLPRWCRLSNDDTWIRYHIHYHLWQLYAYFVVRRLHRQVRFDVVHHLILGTHWKPSFLALLPIPFLWGPLGGGESVPPPFLKDFSLRGRLTEAFRVFVRTVAELDPFVRLTARRSRLTLTKTTDTAKRVELLGGTRVQVFSEAALPAAELDQLGALPLRFDGPFRFIGMGRLLYWKGFALSVRAFALVVKEHPTAEFWIVGDGPERESLEKLARQLGVYAQVRFTGGLPRAQIFQVLAECDVLLHPSLHDSGGWVCLEAMAARRPVVCLDLGGPAVQVTSETGFKIPAFTPVQAVDDLAEAMVTLAGDRRLVASLGHAGRKHVMRHFAWKNKARSIVPIYEQVAGRGDSPEHEWSGAPQSERHAS